MVLHYSINVERSTEPKDTEIKMLGSINASMNKDTCWTLITIYQIVPHLSTMFFYNLIALSYTKLMNSMLSIKLHQSTPAGCLFSVFSIRPPFSLWDCECRLNKFALRPGLSKEPWSRGESWSTTDDASEYDDFLTTCSLLLLLLLLLQWLQALVGLSGLYGWGTAWFGRSCWWTLVARKDLSFRAGPSFILRLPVRWLSLSRDKQAPSILWSLKFWNIKHI